ncbi:MAG: inorganic phosphate transporter [Gemmatimonadota bacterium]|nr:inorganic phosphate transporter [Gemmatimonadota bacterium]MDE3128844.1 inorganic phosphate transporter [Gemmatimonadota bacterium]MDE3174327.1 inorganic phosphate transporter [Gemmatimonadota bacterium]
MAAFIVAIIGVALVFDFSNGFHDSANSIATIVGTRVLSPLAAVVWAASFNFAALFIVKTAVAKAIGSGMVEQSVVTPNLILAALLGAIAWNLITWYYGIPSSSSHALIGGYAGAAIAKAGISAILWGTKWKQTLWFIVISPIVGLVAGYLLMVLVYWAFRRSAPARVDRFFRPAQIASSALLSLSHGGNDAQKTMGIVVALLVSVHPVFANQPGILHHLYLTDANTIPLWVEVIAYTSISLGTLFGGWRIVHTMGSRITKLRPVGGFCAETGGAMAILLATRFGIPVSTTHTITGSIVGVGATHRLSAVRWGIAGRIVWAWILTIPAAGALSAVGYIVLRGLIGA